MACARILGLVIGLLFASPLAMAEHATETTLRIGRIDDATVAPALQAIDGVTTGSLLHIILDSPGGSAATAGRLIAAIGRAQVRQVQVVTDVPPGASCYSMCVNVFLAAGHRRFAPDSRWGFHAARRGDEVDPETTRQMREHMARQAAPGFVSRLAAAGAFDRLDLTILPGSSLAQAGFAKG